MPRVGVYTPEVAEFIHEVVNRLVAAGYVTKKGGVRTPENNYQQALMYRTPTSGIPAASGNTLGKASCTPLGIDPGSDDLIELTDNEGNTTTHEVFNPFSGDVGGDKIIIVNWMYGRRIVHAEDCG